MKEINRQGRQKRTDDGMEEVGILKQKLFYQQKQRM